MLFGDVPGEKLDFFFLGEARSNLLVSRFLKLSGLRAQAIFSRSVFSAFFKTGGVSPLRPPSELDSPPVLVSKPVKSFRLGVGDVNRLNFSRKLIFRGDDEVIFSAFFETGCRVVVP